jgi:hypothetical protein
MTEWPFKFDVKKAVQAAAVLLKLQPGLKDDYRRLISLLYMADRESLKETGQPMSIHQELRSAV